MPVAAEVNGSHPIETPAPASESPAAAWLREQPVSVREALEALGKLLATTPPELLPENDFRFSTRVLGLPTETQRLGGDSQSLDGLSRITMGLAMAEAIAAHDAEVGPHTGIAPPSWTSVPLTKTLDLRIPQMLSAGFPAGTLHREIPVVVRFDGRQGFHDPEISITVRPEHEGETRGILRRLRERADQLNPYRGRWNTASISPGGKLQLTVEEPPALTRADVVAPDEVWAALDSAAAAVSTSHSRLLEAQLGGRRAVLIAGAPGNGKTQSAKLIAAELNHDHDFTVLQVVARAGDALGSIMEQAVTLAPAVVLIDDIDLLGIKERGTAGSGRGLHEVLSAMESHPEAPVLTVATANTLRGLDAAAIRPGRFDSLLTVGNPTREEAELLLRAFLRQVPGGLDVDVAAVAALLPTGGAAVSGAHLREAVRRGVLAGTPVTTDTLAAVIRSPGWLPQTPKSTGGHYL